MPRDTTRFHRLDMLTRDAESIDQCATRLAGLIGYIRHAAKDCADHVTAERLNEWAQGLCDATHGDLAAVMAAHERACDDERAEPQFKLDPVLAVTFGMRFAEAADDAAPLVEWVGR